MNIRYIARIACAALFVTAISSAAPPAKAPRASGGAARSLHTGTVVGQLLTLNDFHGSIAPNRTITLNDAKTPVGGAATLAAMFRSAKARNPNTLVVNAGDMVGGSPPLSALYQDEPTVEFLNMAGCDVGTLGNHEFDEGAEEMRRLWLGGAHPASRYYPKPFPGAKFPVVCANVLDARTGKPLMPPYVVKKVGGVRVGFIGAVTADLSTDVAAAGLAGTRFVAPAQAINRWAAHLRKYGVRSIVVLIHEGGSQNPESPGGALSGPILDIAKSLDPEVDILVTGHTHRYHNTFVGRMLVIQARSHGEAIGRVEFTMDRGSADIIRKRGQVAPTVQDGVSPAADVAAMVAAYGRLAAPRIDKVVARSAREMGRAGAGGESMLGNLIADAQRAAMKADIALMNPGGIRADLPAGPITWGQLYSIQPFGNQLVTLRMTGAQIRAALEQQWGPDSAGEERFTPLQISGLAVVHNPSEPFGRRIVSLMRANGEPVEPDRVYTVAVNSFLADGGDGFTVFRTIRDRVIGPNDLEALIEYLTLRPDIVPDMGRVRVVP